MSQRIRPNKGKRNRNSIQGIERFEKQLKYCGLKEIDDDDHYYIHLFRQLYHVDDEEKVILVQKLYSEMEKENKIKYIVKHSLLSIILEETLSIAPVSNIASVMKVFSEEMRILCADAHASRVLQALLSFSFKHIQNWDRNEEDCCSEDKSLSHAKHNEMFTQFILNTSKFVFNNLHEFVSAAYASHIVCLVLQICSGVQVPDSVTCSTRYMPSYTIGDTTKTKFNVSEELLNLFKKSVMRLTQIPDFTDVISSHCGSAVLQTALLIVSLSGDADLCETLVYHILQHGFKGLDSSPPDQREGLHPLFENNAACRLFEIVLSVAPDEQLQEIFEFYFQHQLPDLLKHSFANFVVQRLLDNWKSKKSFSIVFNAVSENLIEAAKAGHSGVIVSFVKASRTHGLENKCKKQLKKIYGCEEDEGQKLSLLLLYFVTLSDYETLSKCDSLPPFSQHGSVIIQELLKFKNPKKIVESLLAIPLNELLNIACSAFGSYIFEAFGTSLSIESESKQRLISNFKGNFFNLACDKHGSRSLEALWSAAEVEDREKICKELSEHSSELTNNQFGRIIYYKFNKLNVFKKENKRDWTNHQNKGFAKRAHVTSMLEETDVVKPSKKRKTKNHDK